MRFMTTCTRLASAILTAACAALLITPCAAERKAAMTNPDCAVSDPTPASADHESPPGTTGTRGWIDSDRIPTLATGFAAETEKPNIVLIVADDLGYLTDRLGEEAVAFIGRQRAHPFFAELTKLHDAWLAEMPNPVKAGAKRYGMPAPEGSVPKRSKADRRKKKAAAAATTHQSPR